jgi:hypothetical protein
VGHLLVGGDQVHVAGVVVAPAAVWAGLAVWAWGVDACPPPGDRVVEGLQLLELVSLRNPDVPRPPMTTARYVLR